MFKSRSPRTFITVVLLTALAILVVLAVFNYLVDPCWVWQGEPFWVHEATDTGSLLVEQMGLAKKLYIRANGSTYDTYLLGSSRVYGGLNPRDLKDVRAYNFSMSGLRMIESAKCIEFLARETAAETIVLEVGYFQFLDPQDYVLNTQLLGQAWWQRFDESVGTLLGGSASWASIHLAFAPEPGFGMWTREGFRSTFHRESADIESMPGLFLGLFRVGVVSTEAMAALEKSMELCEEHDIELVLFIDPWHESLWDTLVKAGSVDTYNAWQDQMQQLAAKHGVTLWDFNHHNPFASVSLAEGSNDYYLDASHFSPYVGRLILSRLGFATWETPDAVTSQFGVLLAQ